MRSPHSNRNTTRPPRPLDVKANPDRNAKIKDAASFRLEVSA